MLMNIYLEKEGNHSVVPDLLQGHTGSVENLDTTSRVDACPVHMNKNF